MRLALAFLSLVLLSWPAPGLAQETVGSPVSPDTRTYGTSAKAFFPLSYAHFTGAGSSASYSLVVLSGTPTVTPAPAAPKQAMVAGINLPDGALVTEIQAVLCDSTDLDGATVAFNVLPRIGLDGSQSVMGPSTTDLEAPGCVDRTVVLDTPIQINNDLRSYYVGALIGPGTGLASVRIGYRLQVSAPGAQVFNDVPPGHPFFQFIQALATSGITTGCQTSPPLFCPDNPLTRGQMAVFLAKALGLHFAAPSP